jgi:hypothetical protein
VTILRLEAPRSLIGLAAPKLTYCLRVRLALTTFVLARVLTELIHFALSQVIPI